MEERRKIERFDLQAQTTIEAELAKGKKTTLTSITKNISSNGTFILTTHPFPEGMPVHLELLLTPEALRKFVGSTGAVKVNVDGRVVRREEEGMAIAFSDGYTMSTLGADGE